LELKVQSLQDKIPEKQICVSVFEKMWINKVATFIFTPHKILSSQKLMERQYTFPALHPSSFPS